MKIKNKLLNMLTGSISLMFITISFDASAISKTETIVKYYKKFCVTLYDNKQQLKATLKQSAWTKPIGEPLTTKFDTYLKTEKHIRYILTLKNNSCRVNMFAKYDISKLAKLLNSVQSLEVIKGVKLPESLSKKILIYRWQDKRNKQLKQVTIIGYSDSLVSIGFERLMH